MRSNQTSGSYRSCTYLSDTNLCVSLDCSRLRLAERLEYGILGANDGMPSTAQAPFGGLKESGYGREGGSEGIEEYLDVKYISLGGMG